jgi:hypothetical protein
MMQMTNPEVFSDGDERGAKSPPIPPNATTQLNSKVAGSPLLIKVYFFRYLIF